MSVAPRRRARASTAAAAPGRARTTTWRAAAVDGLGRRSTTPKVVTPKAATPRNAIERKHVRELMPKPPLPGGPSAAVPIPPDCYTLLPNSRPSCSKPRRSGRDRPRRVGSVMLDRVSIAITEDHRTLAGTVADFLAKNGSRAAARALLEAPSEPNASFYGDAAALGWLGLHVAEAYGGAGGGGEEGGVLGGEAGQAPAPRAL